MSPSAGTTIVTAPAEIRPPTTIRVSAESSSLVARGRAELSTAGNLNVAAPGEPGTFYDIAGLSYFLA